VSAAARHHAELDSGSQVALAPAMMIVADHSIFEATARAQNPRCGEKRSW